jgi:flagellin-like hook-associated protein FlgL
MQAQIRGLDRASLNADDGIALIKTAEGGLQGIGDMLQRIRELVNYAANDTNENNLLGTGDRQKIQDEINQLIQEIDEMATRVEFNKKALLDGSFADTNAVLKEAIALRDSLNLDKVSTEVRLRAIQSTIGHYGVGPPLQAMLDAKAADDVNADAVIKQAEGTAVSIQNLFATGATPPANPVGTPAPPVAGGAVFNAILDAAFGLTNLPITATRQYATVSETATFTGTTSGDPLDPPGQALPTVTHTRNHTVTYQVRDDFNTAFEAFLLGNAEYQAFVDSVYELSLSSLYAWNDSNNPQNVVKEMLAERFAAEMVEITEEFRANVWPTVTPTRTLTSTVAPGSPAVTGGTLPMSVRVFDDPLPPYDHIYETITLANFSGPSAALATEPAVAPGSGGITVTLTVPGAQVNDFVYGTNVGTVTTAVPAGYAARVDAGMRNLLASANSYIDGLNQDS